MKCKNCGKELLPTYYHKEFCNNKCSNQFKGKQKNPIYVLVRECEEISDVSEDVLKKLYKIDTYEISKTLKTYDKIKLLTGYREFKNTHKLCLNCGDFYEVTHSKSAQICPRKECESYYKEKNKNSQLKNNATKLKRYGDSKYNNREKFKETCKLKSPEEIELWNLHRSEALQKSEEEWEQIITKRRETYRERTGYANPGQNPEVREKTKQTNLKKYGAESPLQNEAIKNKMKETEFKKYGGSHNATELCKSKIKITKLERYGDSNYNNREKNKTTIKERYGVEYISQSTEIQDRVKQTNIEKYGVEHHTQSPRWKVQTFQKYKEKYGVGFAPKKHLKNLENYNDRDFWISEFGEYKNDMLYINFDKIYEHFGILAHSTVYKKLSELGIEFRRKSNYGKTEIEFLTALNIPNLKLQHRVGNFRVDAYDSETNTIYEFLGDYWHGKPNNDKLTYFGESFASLHRQTFERFDKIKSKGYKILYIWESDYVENGIGAILEY